MSYRITFEQDKFVRKSLELYAMHYFMTQVLLFTNDSADKAVRSLRAPTRLHYTRTLTSKLISRQIKHAMDTLLRAKTEEILKELENKLMTKAKAAWAPSFCAISILCMCGEMIQVNTDIRVVYQMRKKSDGGIGKTQLSRDTSIKICRELEDLPISLCMKMFHEIYKSPRRGTGCKSKQGFNPVRDGLDVNAENGIGQATVDLVNEVRRIMDDNGQCVPLLLVHTELMQRSFTEKEIDERLKNPSFDHRPDLSDLLERHMTFRKGNPGRLVAKYLRSFPRTHE